MVKNKLPVPVPGEHDWKKYNFNSFIVIKEASHTGDKAFSSEHLWKILTTKLIPHWTSKSTNITVPETTSLMAFVAFGSIETEDSPC